MNADMTPCPSLALYRRAAGLSQAEMAEAIGRSRRQYQRDEATGHAPQSVIDACASVLCVPPSDLCSPSGKGPDRELATLARRHQRACERVRESEGARAYASARARLVAAQPSLASMIPE